MSRIASAKIEHQKTKDQKRKDRASKQLEKEMSTKIRTSFIFALAEIERIFGELWKHNEDGDLDEIEQEWKEAYQEFRKAVLDNGNAQIRALEDHIKNYDIDFVRNVIIMKPLQGDNRE